MSAVGTAMKMTKESVRAGPKLKAVPQSKKQSKKQPNIVPPGKVVPFPFTITDELGSVINFANALGFNPYSCPSRPERQVDELAALLDWFEQTMKRIEQFWPTISAGVPPNVANFLYTHHVFLTKINKQLKSRLK